MSCCLSNLKELCTLNVCDNLVIPAEWIPAEIGEWRLRVFFLDSEYEIPVTREETEDDLSFPLSGLNEYYEHQAVIINPEGSQEILEIDGIGYNGVNFKTTKRFTL